MTMDVILNGRGATNGRYCGIGGIDNEGSGGGKNGCRWQLHSCLGPYTEVIVLMVRIVVMAAMLDMAIMGV